MKLKTTMKSWLGAVARVVVCGLLIVQSMDAQTPLPNEFNTTALAPERKAVAVLRVRWAGEQSHQVAIGTIIQRVSTDSDSANAYYQEMTAGQEFIGSASHNVPQLDVYGSASTLGVYPLPGLTGAAGDDVASAVEGVFGYYETFGFNPSQYHCIFLLFGHSSTRPTLRMLERPDGSWRNVFELNGIDKVAVCAALQKVRHPAEPQSWLDSGLRGANGLSCNDGVGGQPVSVSDDFTIRYGEDPFDMEGAAGGFRHPNAVTKMRKRWCLSTNFRVFELREDASWTIDLLPLDHATTGLQIARIELPSGRLPIWGTPNDTPRLHYYLEFRQPTALQTLPSSSPVYHGVSIRLGGSHRHEDTRLMSLLVDTHPQTSSLEDAPLMQGEVFEDVLSGITIETLNVTPQMATVRITRSSFTTSIAGPRVLWERGGPFFSGSTPAYDAVLDSAVGGGARAIGPYAGLRPVCYSRKNGAARLVWCRESDGLAKVWSLDENDNVFHIETWGPAPGWTVKGFDLMADGTSAMLWTHTNRSALIWTMDRSGEIVDERYRAPVGNVVAESLERLPGGLDRLLCRDLVTNAALLVDLRLDGSVADMSPLSPTGAFVVNDYELVTGGVGAVLMNRPDGLARVWLFDVMNQFAGQQDLTPPTSLMNPFAAWSARSISGE